MTRAVDIFHAIELAISRGELKPGERLLPMRDAAVHWSVNKNTVGAAYRLLQEAGLVQAAGRNGSAVASRVPAVRELPDAPVAAQAPVCAVHDGSPDPALLPSQALLRDHLDRVTAGFGGYGDQRNSTALLEWADAMFEAEGIRSSQSFVSSGGMDAISLALRSNLRAGDHVGLENPGHATTLALARSLGLCVVPIEIDDAGMRPEALRRAIDSGCKAVVFSARGQNPTGAAITAERARALRKIIADSEEALFIDDDHSSLLRLAPYQGVAAGSARRWLVVRSLSKFLGPDLRVAVSRGDDATMARIEEAQALSSGWVSTLLQELAAALLADPAVQALIDKAGADYRGRFAALQRDLSVLGIPAVGTAGLNLWVPCDDGPGVTARLFARGWQVRPGIDFTVDDASAFRVTCAAMDDAKRLAFVQALRGALVSPS